MVEFAAGEAPQSDAPGPGPRARALGLSFRPVGDADLAFLERLYGSTRTDELAQTGWTEADKQSFIAMQFAAQHKHYLQHYPDAHWLVVEQDGDAMGRLYIEHWPSQHRIVDIALLPERRGQGLGEAMMRDLMDAAAGEGKAVSIHVEKFNPAMRLYHRLGFTKIEDKGVYDLMEWRAVGVR